MLLKDLRRSGVGAWPQ